MGILERTRVVAAVTVLLTGCTTVLQIDDGDGPSAPAVDGGAGEGAAPPGIDGAPTRIDAGADPDGDLLPPEDASPATDAMTTPPCAVMGAPDCERVVFLTKLPVASNVAAIGDDHCTELAAGSAHPRIKNRNFQAWITSSGGSVATRFVHGTGPYVRTTGQNIAASWTDLTDGKLPAAIFFDQNGDPVAGNPRVWTGTQGNGLPTGVDCAGWTALLAGTGATAGIVAGALGNWSAYTPDLDCATGKAHLYCFEK